MVHYDATQTILSEYLYNTQCLLDDFLRSTFGGTASVKAISDLGFPHDVVRIAGGFATGAFVEWTSTTPFIPVDTCVNVCTATFFEVKDDIGFIFNEEQIKSFNSRLERSIYISNFHRGNHFISYLKSKRSGKLYLLFHSSANEYKENFNGLYPIEGNWYFDKIKTFSDGKSYFRYLDGKDAEVFYRIAQGLYTFNEIRHELIAHVLLGSLQSDNEVLHYHHYGMPSSSSVIMGGHILNDNEVAPILTLPGENLYFVKFHKAKEQSLKLNGNKFLAPHGWGKRHKGTPKIMLDIKKNKFVLDDESYEIKFGTSLRSHPNLELRDFQSQSKNRHDGFFEHLEKLYDFEIMDELEQIASLTKAGVKLWC